MDPKLPETPEDRALEATANDQRAEPSEVERSPGASTEAKSSLTDVENAAIDDPGADADATTGAVDPADLFSSFGVGVQSPLGLAPDARAESPAIETARDNVLASAQSFTQDVFASPAIEEIVASLSATPISDVPAATAARDVAANWQDVPAEFGPDHDKATADYGETTHDRVREDDPQSAPTFVDVGAFMATEPVEPPSGANDDFGTFDRAPRANPADNVVIGNFLGPSNDPTVIQRGPIRTDGDSWRPSITLLSENSGDPSAPEPASDADLSPRATSLQTPISDGGPPLARPILMASVPDEQTRQLLDELLAEAGQRDAKTAAEIAQQQVEDAFWLRACEERALYGGR